jgi:glycosyltransferase involved in cell wall biosynthesis
MNPLFHEELLAYRGDAETEVSANAYLSVGKNADGSLTPSPGKMKLVISPAKRVPSLPLISCLMPTKNRFEQAKMAVASYRRQTWPNRELIVLDQNPDDRLGQWIATLGDQSIRYTHMPGLAEPLGTIRNRTVQMSSGALLCVWDDDDMQHPARLEIATAAMSASKAAACVLVREVVWMPQKRRIGLRQARFYCNTLLAMRGVGVHYPPIQRGEDMVALQAILAKNRVIWLDLPELYVYVVHGRNTWDEVNMERSWEKASHREEGAASDTTLAQLSRIYPMTDYATLLAGIDAHAATAPATA